ncbi:MAG: 6-bladed beta-propeller [Candidatus Latescibacterota bacterium]|nr:MAG: 6-bladed beta-propeller [Candidatus Latescibacterota bacterium]
MHTDPDSRPLARSVLSRHSFLTVVVIGIVFVLAILAPAVKAASWEGKEVVQDGIPHIQNPATPISEPATLSPKELWRVSGDEDDEFLFGVLSEITCDGDGNIYLLDSQLSVVMVFSEGGEYLRSIGREGEGPGEFRRATDLFMTPDGNVAVMQRMPGKIVVLTPDGEPVGELPVPQPADGGMQMFAGGHLAGDHVVINTNRFLRHDDGFEVTSTIIAVDPDGNEMAEYFAQSEKNSFANMTFDERTGMAALVWSAGSDGRVYTSDVFDKYGFKVWNSDGTLDRVVDREYVARERSEEEMKRNAPRIMLRRGNRTETPEVKTSKTDRDIQRFYPRDDGTLWVLSSRGAFDAPDDVIATFDVFDHGGQFTQQVTFNGEGDYADDGFYIVKDRLYVVTDLRSARRAMFGGHEEEEDDEDFDEEPMTVICYDLGPIVQTMK